MKLRKLIVHPRKCGVTLSKKMVTMRGDVIELRGEVVTLRNLVVTLRGESVAPRSEGFFDWLRPARMRYYKRVRGKAASRETLPPLLNSSS
ncbi:MAG: hypothetical protein H7Z16_16585 [Pyrinomonadaceae bacterium]|nr:hypothetical protein [Pyrinomonadaceae bacterium]